MHTNPDNILSKDILFSYGSYYTSLVKVLVWLSEAATEFCCKKIVLISMNKIFKKYLLEDFIFSKVTDCRHATWLKINFFTDVFYCVTGVTGQRQLASFQSLIYSFSEYLIGSFSYFIRALSKIMKMHCDTVS